VDIALVDGCRRHQRLLFGLMEKVLLSSRPTCLTAGEVIMGFKPTIYLHVTCRLPFTSLYAALTTVSHTDDMPMDKSSARKQGVRAHRGKGSQLTNELRAPGLQVSSGFEDLDEETLLSLSVDAPVRLSPPPKTDSLIPETSPPTPLSKMHISNELMAATLERLGFGPPNDLSNLLTSPSPTPANSEVNITGASGYEEKLPTAEGTISTLEASHTDDSDAYGQINDLFQQITQRSGHSVNTLILKWALLHAHSDVVKRQIAHNRMLDLMAAHQRAFDKEVNKAISLVRESFFIQLSRLLIIAFQGTGLADVGIDFMFVMVGQNATKDASMGKVWSTPGLQGVRLSTSCLYYPSHACI
jgi:hypothetical protein